MRSLTAQAFLTPALTTRETNQNNLERWLHHVQRRVHPEAEAGHLVHRRRLGGKAVRDVEIGCRNIDTAQAYANERGVGEGLRTSEAGRDELFVSTKLAAEIKNFDGAIAAIDRSLRTLGIDVIDLMLITAAALARLPRRRLRPR